MAKATVLLVDDEPVFLEGLKTGLSLLSHLILTAASGAEALEILEGRKVDVMITDLRMPGMDGLELITRADRLRLHLDYIVLTGHGDMQDYNKAMNLGVKHFIKKPPDVELLDKYIRELQREKGRGSGGFFSKVKGLFSG